MLRIDIFQLSEVVLEPEYWVKTTIEFISKNSNLNDLSNISDYGC